MARLLAVLLGLCAAGTAFEVDAAVLTGVRHLSSSNYTRLILDLSGPVRFTIHTLAAVPRKRLPPRIYLDLAGTRLKAGRQIEVGDSLVRRIRLSQYRTDVVRVVLDLKRPGSHDAVRLSNPRFVEPAADAFTPPAGARREPAPGR